MRVDLISKLSELIDEMALHEAVGACDEQLVIV